MQMDQVGDELTGDGFVHQRGTQQARIAMVQGLHGVKQMGHMGEARLKGVPRLLPVGRRMGAGQHHLALQVPGDLQRALAGRVHGQHLDAFGMAAVHGFPVLHRRGHHVLFLLGALIDRVQVGTLHIKAQGLGALLGDAVGKAAGDGAHQLQGRGHHRGQESRNAILGQGCAHGRDGPVRILHAVHPQHAVLMQVDKARRKDFPLGVHCFIGAQVFTDGRDFAALHLYVQLLELALGRKDPRALDYKAFHGFSSLSCAPSPSSGRALSCWIVW